MFPGGLAQPFLEPHTDDKSSDNHSYATLPTREGLSSSETPESGVILSPSPTPQQHHHSESLYTLGKAVQFTSRSPTPQQLPNTISSIPTPSSKDEPYTKYTPFALYLVVALGTPFLMFACGVTLEILTALSAANGGFKTSSWGGLFQDVSGQFVVSFLPVLAMIPFSTLWRQQDWSIRLYQPYLSLWRGNVTAEEGLLTDYIYQGPFLALFRARKFQHYVVFWSSFSALMTYAFQPLAGSVFQIQFLSRATNLSLPIIEEIALSPDVNTLGPFLAAAGYVNAAVTLNLTDPRFVAKGWSTAAFVPPVESFLNGTMVFFANGIQTSPQCANSVNDPVITPVADTTEFNITATSVQGCTGEPINFDSSSPTNAYGVQDAQCPSDPPGSNPAFRSIMFWFIRTQGNNNQTGAKVVFCSPTILALQATVTVDLNTGLYTEVINQDVHVIQNLTDNALSGHAYNGLTFPLDPDPTNTMTSSNIRAIVTWSIVTAARQSPTGLLGTFDLPTGFLDLTTQVYTQFLAVVARSIYFVPLNDNAPAQVTSLVERVMISPLPSHILAITLMFVGILGLVVQSLHRRQRLKLFFATPPGSIASTVALTSRSGFGVRLFPFDDETTIEKKLDGLRFSLDKRTGAIVAEDAGSRRYTSHDSLIPLSSSFVAQSSAMGYHSLAKEDNLQVYSPRSLIDR